MNDIRKKNIIIKKMKVISWDIGLKNLSYCILKDSKEDGPITKHGYTILDWEVIDLYSDEGKIYPCCGLTKKKKVCGKKSKYYENIGEEEKKYYCKTHKTETSQEIKKPKNPKNRNPFEYATRIKQELDKRPHLIEVDAVIIENQPALTNPIMKTVQMIIFSYFSFKHSPENPFLVKNINAKRKEKLPEKDNDWENSAFKNQYLERIKTIKDKYRRRKFLCFYYAKLCLETSLEMQEFLSNHKKKDDLTDSFLMCMDWFLRK